MRYSVHYVGDGVKHVETFEALHATCFPGTLKYGPTRKGCGGGHWFLVQARDDGDEPRGQMPYVGFAVLRPSLRWRKTGYLERAGVLPAHRGNKLQLKLIRTRIKLARTLGMGWLVTETIDNPPSANNLITAGFRVFDPKPADRWNKQRDVTFWRCVVKGKN